MFDINFIVFAINITSRHIICFMSHALNRNNYVNQMSLPGNSPISSQKPGDQEEREDDYSESDDNLKTGDDLETSDNLEKLMMIKISVIHVSRVEHKCIHRSK